MRGDRHIASAQPRSVATRFVERSPTALRLSNICPDSAVRCVLLVFIVSLPFLYDPTVPDSAAEIRATATHVCAGLTSAILLASAFFREFRKSGEHHEQWSPRIPVIGWLATGLALWAGVSLFGATNVSRGIRFLVTLHAQLILGIVTATVWSPRFARRLTWAVAIPALFTSSLGIIQYLGINDATVAHWLQGQLLDPILNFYQQTAVPGSTFANKNVAASWTAMIIPLAVHLVLTNRAGGRALAGVILTTAVLFLVFSRSRASWISLGAALSVAGLAAALVAPWRRHLGAASITLMILPVLIGIPYLAYDGLDILQARAGTERGWEDVRGRLAYNLNGLMIVWDHWFNGVGPGGFFTVYPLYHDAVMPTPLRDYDVLARPLHAHNDALQAFIEMGVPGGLLYAGLLGVPLIYALRIGTRDAEKRVSLWPLFAGASLLTVGFNALLDFPLQLPTAPATAALLIGGLVAQTLTRLPASFARLPFSRFSPLRRGAVVLALALVVTGSAAAWQDDCLRRQAHQLLKSALSRTASGIVDEETLRLIKLAHHLYPEDRAVNEHLATVHANYQGRQPLSIEERVGAIETALAHDPWSPYLLTILGEQYLGWAGSSAAEGSRNSAMLLSRAADVYARLQPVAGFSPRTYGIGGILALLRRDFCGAASLLTRARAIDANYMPAIVGLHTIEQMNVRC
jgi:hypothetical protein